MNPPAPLVSVLISCYNYGRFLAQAVNSALNQSHPNVEVLILDDASTDNTREVAESYGTRVRYLSLPHGGQATALNTGLQQARGEYCVFLDADNYLAPHFIEKTLAILASCRDPFIAFVYTARQLFGKRQEVFHPPPYDLAQLKLRNFIDMCVLVRLSDCRNIQFCPERDIAPVPDMDFFLSLAEQGKGGLLLDEPLVHYRIHDSNMSQAASRSYRQVKIIRAIMRRHRTLYTPRDEAQALEIARSRAVLAIIHNRLPDRPLRTRLFDLVCFIASRPAPGQVWHQLLYTVKGALPPPS